MTRPSVVFAPNWLGDAVMALPAIADFCRARHDRPIDIAALHVITTLTGSALMALAHALDAMDANAVWKAAHVDEDFQIAQWGWDAEAQARRKARETDFQASIRLLALSISGPI